MLLLLSSSLLLLSCVVVVLSCVVVLDATLTHVSVHTRKILTTGLD